MALVSGWAQKKSITRRVRQSNVAFLAKFSVTTHTCLYEILCLNVLCTVTIVKQLCPNFASGHILLNSGAQISHRDTYLSHQPLFFPLHATPENEGRCFPRPILQSLSGTEGPLNSCDSTRASRLEFLMQTVCNALLTSACTRGGCTRDHSTNE